MQSSSFKANPQLKHFFTETAVSFLSSYFCPSLSILHLIKNINGKIIDEVEVISLPDQISYGLYEDETLLIKQDDEHLPNTPYGLYGGFTHDLMMNDNGKIMYFIVSQWNKVVYCSELFEVHFK